MDLPGEKIFFRLQLRRAVFVPAILVLLMILSRLLESGMDWNFYVFGIRPRRIESLWTVFSVGFVHADWDHLFNNCLSFAIMSVLLFYFYRILAMRILCISYLGSGLLVWLIGRDACHIGASGWIYGIAFFLFFSGLFRKMESVISVSFIVALLYGSMVWHIMPWMPNDPVSWEGHLSGGITGLVLAIVYRNKEPQPLEDAFEEEEEDSHSDPVNESNEI